MHFIPMNALKAVSRFAAVKDVRYCLRGVKVEGSPKETRLVATDGHTLAIYRYEAIESQVNSGYCDAILPADVVKTVLRWKGAESLALENVTGDRWKLSVLGGQVIEFAAIDGKFPEYSRAIPKTTSGEAAQFNPAYLLRCHEAVRDVAGMSKRDSVPVPHVSHNGKRAALIVAAPLVCAVMPLRTHGKGQEPTAPAWLWEEVAKAPAKLRALRLSGKAEHGKKSQ